MAAESKIEATLSRRVVRELGGLCIKLLPSVAGLPDRMVILPGGNIRLLELKAPNGRLRPIQQVWHARAAALGVEVAVLSSVEEVDQWIKENLP